MDDLWFGFILFLGRTVKVGVKKPLDLLLLRQIILGRRGTDDRELSRRRAIALASRPRFTHIWLKPIPGAVKDEAQIGELGKEVSD